jgi:pantetheine-phosphate adenylyltransferase
LKRSAVYPGTFDPITRGHIDLMERSCRLFDRLVVAIARNPQKKPLFTAEERLEMARESLAHIDCVEVVIFDTLLIDLARDQGCRAIVRGLRAISDFEYELQIALLNRKMAPDLETVFLTPSYKYVYLSSSIVKELATYRGDVADFVPPPVEKRLREKFPAPPQEG